MLGIFIAVILVAGNGPSHGQEADAEPARVVMGNAQADVADEANVGATDSVAQASAGPVVTRAGAHDDYGRMGVRLAAGCRIPGEDRRKNPDCHVWPPTSHNI